MNSSPMIFLFVSGSAIPASFDKNLSLAFIRIRLMSNCCLNIFSTSSPSFLRKSPWSTKIQVKFLPIAFESKTAATEESTPPDNAHKAFLSPIFSFKLLIVSCVNELITQSAEQLQILNKKFLIT